MRLNEHKTQVLTPYGRQFDNFSLLFFFLPTLIHLYLFFIIVNVTSCVYDALVDFSRRKK